jgi:DNA ligase-4
MSQADPSQDVHTFEANDELVKPPELDRKPGQASPPFSVFATSLDMILRNRRNPKQTDKKRDIIEKFFNEWRKRVDLDLFPVVRLLLPEVCIQAISVRLGCHGRYFSCFIRLSSQRDRQRATYGVKEQALAKIICKVLGLDVHKSPDAHRLINWKEPLKDEVPLPLILTLMFSVRTDLSLC